MSDSDRDSSRDSSDDNPPPIVNRYATIDEVQAARKTLSHYFREGEQPLDKATKAAVLMMAMRRDHQV